MSLDIQYHDKKNIHPHTFRQTYDANAKHTN